MLTIAKDDHSLSLSTLIALDIAAETIRLLLDEDDITKGPHWPNSSSVLCGASPAVRHDQPRMLAAGDVISSATSELRFASRHCTNNRRGVRRG